MKLSLADAAALLDIAEEDVYSWAEDGKLPAQRIRGQFRVNRTELLEWASENDISLSPHAFDARPFSSIADALRRGGVAYDVPATTPAELAREVVTRLPIDERERETLLAFAAARRELGLRIAGEGIAIPHVRMPAVVATETPILSLTLLMAPVTLGGSALSAVFFLASPTVHAHIAMLAKLSWALRHGVLREAIASRRPAEAICAAAAEAEEAR